MSDWQTTIECVLFQNLTNLDRCRGSLRCIGADQIFIENAERFARIDLDLSDFEKECTHYVAGNYKSHFRVYCLL